MTHSENSSESVNSSELVYVYNREIVRLRLQISSGQDVHMHSEWRRRIHGFQVTIDSYKDGSLEEETKV